MTCHRFPFLFLSIEVRRFVAERLHKHCYLKRVAALYSMHFLNNGEGVVNSYYTLTDC